MQLLEVKYLQRKYFTIVWAIRFLGGKQFVRADTGAAAWLQHACWLEHVPSHSILHFLDKKAKAQSCGGGLLREQICHTALNQSTWSWQSCPLF